MFRTLALLLLLAAPAAAQQNAAAPQPPPQAFTIRTLTAQMRYDVTELTVAPGAQVKLVFENTDDMPHNIVFFQPGTNVVEASNKQMERPEEALKRNWLPEDPRIWLHSRALNPKEREELVFKAPEKPGIYPFVCTFPGHAVTMQGQLKVFAPGPQLTSLRFALYLGDWSQLPDFSKLTPHRQGDVPDNLIQIKLDDYKNQFGIVYSGKLNVPKEGEYTFALACDDGARLLIDGKKVVEHDGIHPSTQIKEGKVKLASGDHDLRLEYFQAAGGAELYVGWRGSNFAITPLSTWLHPQWNGAKVAKKDTKTGMPLAVAGEPVVYRNFIAGAGNRSIAVGYPGNVSLAWSAETMNLALVWRGAFMDAARHWIDRGGGHQPPLGYDVFRPAGEGALPFAVLASPDAEWPALKKHQRADGYQWKGYTLDAKRLPTFSYTWKGVAVSDRFEVEGDAVTGQGRLIRTLTLNGEIPAGATFRAAAGGSIQPAGDGAFLVDAGQFGFDGRNFENKFKVAVEGAAVSGGKALLVPVRRELRVTYSWPHYHAHPNTAAGHAHAH
jgi:plastocyanin